jgi:hypothetical protein
MSCLEITLISGQVQTLIGSSNLGELWMGGDVLLGAAEVLSL